MGPNTLKIYYTMFRFPDVNQNFLSLYSTLVPLVDPASLDTVEYEGWHMKQCCIQYLERISSLFGVTLLFFSWLTPNDMIFMSGETPNTIS